MNKTLISLLTCGSISLALFSGCESGPNAQNGAAWGALTGAALGAIVGHQSGDGAEGAAIGAVVGGAVGHAVGNERDEHYAETQHYQTELEIAQARQARAEAQARQERMVI
ncbi:MAG: glycine zipper 2TM domain-containing protein, partial [Verrucomicrobiae bacterium]|nr:glycine zipper 2TM domain-containing protein [Verrucomicrobiae bacterium]